MLGTLKTELFTAFENYKRIGLLTHTNPDGDGLAACLALQEFLKMYKLDAEIILEKTPADVFDFLNAKKRTIVFDSSLEYDLIIVIDCHEPYRVGICEPLLNKAQKVIAIDHHQPSDKINNAYTYIDTKMVSAGAIIFEAIYEKALKLEKSVQNYFATAIYTTILNDTDNFINANVDKKTFEICTKLMDFDFYPHKVAEMFLFNKPAAQIKFNGQVLATMQSYEDDKIVFVHSTQKMLEQLNLNDEATAKMTRWLKGMKNLRALAYFHEKLENTWVISLRSNKINVNQIAVKFGGGGHKNASGCTATGTLAELKTTFLNEIKKQL